MSKKLKSYRYRSAISGQWVSEEYAKANPSTTVREVIPSPELMKALKALSNNSQEEEE